MQLFLQERKEIWEEKNLGRRKTQAEAAFLLQYFTWEPPDRRSSIMTNDFRCWFREAALIQFQVGCWFGNSSVFSQIPIKQKKCWVDVWRQSGRGQSGAAAHQSVGQIEGLRPPFFLFSSLLLSLLCFCRSFSLSPSTAPPFSLSHAKSCHVQKEWICRTTLIPQCYDSFILRHILLSRLQSPRKMLWIRWREKREERRQREAQEEEEEEEPVTERDALNLSQPPETLEPRTSYASGMVPPSLRGPVHTAQTALDALHEN